MSGEAASHKSCEAAPARDTRRRPHAERERRAKIINAEAEFQAADKLSQAARIFRREPGTLQLRYLQTLLALGAEQNSTIVFPLPIDLVRPLLEWPPNGEEVVAAKV